LIGVFREREYIHGKSVISMPRLGHYQATKMPGQIKMAMQNM